MSKESLTQIYAVAHRVVLGNMDGITHEESLVTPNESGNCMNWVAGHILATRDLFLSKMGGETFLSDEEARPYSRGAPPLKPGDPCMEWERIQEGLGATNTRFQELLGSLSRNDLDEDVDPNLFPVEMEKPTRGTLLTLILFHESYHAGQLGTLRRLLGKEGIIK